MRCIINITDVPSGDRIVELICRSFNFKTFFLLLR
jgi:hypothetical protein